MKQTNWGEFMGVSEPTEYTITPHAEMRIRERFGLANADMKQWLVRFLSEATYDKSQSNGRDIYKKGPIAAVLDRKNKQVITMYALDTQTIKIADEQINPELKSFLNKAGAEFLELKRKKLANGLKGELTTNFRAKLSAFKKKASDENLEELKNSLNGILEEINKYEMHKREVENF